MIKVVSFCRPASLDEALDSMASRHLTPIAGGTDIVPQMRDGEPRELIDTARLGLDHVNGSGSVIEIGASVTHSRLCGDPVVRELLPLLSKAAGSIGCEQIRNRGTIGGNVVNASPSADTVPALLNYDAEVVLVSKGEKRTVRLEEFMTRPYETDRRPGELLTSIMCKATGALRGVSDSSNASDGSADRGTSTCFLKLGRRAAMNISRMSLALIIACGAGAKITLARVSAGAVFPVARRMLEVERLLEGQVMSRKLFEEAGTLATELLVMETGIRWSTPYKMPVLKGLLERALRQLARDNGVIVE